MTSGIYSITSPSGKKYVGQSWAIESRFKKYNQLHCKGQSKLYNSLIKYGCINHNFEIIQQFNFDETQPQLSQTYLNTLENFHWLMFKADGFEMLNIRIPNGSRGKHSQETKLKMSNAAKGKKKSIEYCKKRTGEKRSQETRLNISLSLRGKMCSDEKKQNLSKRFKGDGNPFFGKKHSEETKLKMRGKRLK